jgi:hypothetical protein
MAVDDLGAIDIIGIDPSGQVALTISDHHDWLQSSSHLLMLQEKINRYLAFVESGEILTSYPKARGRQVVIRIVFKYEPDEIALQILLARNCSAHGLE